MLPIRIIFAVLLGFASLVGCAPSGPGSASKSAEDVIFLPEAKLRYQEDTEHYDESGRVRVRLSAAWSDEQQLVLRGIFEPEDTGFHLYSCDMPKGGVNGFGRPTLLEVDSTVEIVEVGRVVADRQIIEHHDATTATTLPIYPNGAVTLYLPLRLKSKPENSLELPIKLTYMSCSDGRCNLPIVEAVVKLTVSLP